MCAGTYTILHLIFQPPRSIRGSVARGDAGNVDRIRPLALAGATAGLLLLVLTLLLGLAFRFPPLRIGGITAIVAAAAGTAGSAARVFAVRAVRVRGGERGARVRIRAVAEAREVALDLADPWAGASFVTFEEDDLDAALGEERVVPEVDQLGGHERRSRCAGRVGGGQLAGPREREVLQNRFVNDRSQKKFGRNQELT